MKLSKLLENWLDSYPIAKQADILGLSYAGYGRWKDDTGKIVAKTVDGKIISIKGVGNRSVISPADNPDFVTSEPIGGDSVDGHGTDVHPNHDAYNELPSRSPISHIIKPIT
jgi:hypothetical protein